MKTIAEVFGPEVANELAKWAIDVLVYPPARIDTYSTRIPAERISDGRAILDDAGIDWRTLKSDGRSESRAAREKAGRS